MGQYKHLPLVHTPTLTLSPLQAVQEVLPFMAYRRCIQVSGAACLYCAAKPVFIVVWAEIAQMVLELTKCKVPLDLNQCTTLALSQLLPSRKKQKDAPSSGAGQFSVLRCLAGAVLALGVFGSGSAKHGTSGSSWWVGGMLASRGDPQMQLGTTKQLSSTQRECTGRSKRSECGSKHADTVPTGLAAAVKSAWQFCQSAWISQTASQKGTEKQGAKSNNFSKVCVKCQFPEPSLPEI